MRAAYDEVMTTAVKRQHAPERVVAELLTAQLADVQSRAATPTRMGNARFPVVKALGRFDFAASPLNAALVRDLPGRLPRRQPQRGPGRGHRLGQDAPGHRDRGELRARARRRGCASSTRSTSSNQLEAEARAGRAGRLATQLSRADLVILDELGYLPFPRAGGQMLFHLISRLYEPDLGDRDDQPAVRGSPGVFEGAEDVMMPLSVSVWRVARASGVRRTADPAA